jgi:hypothetical protein
MHLCAQPSRENAASHVQAGVGENPTLVKTTLKKKLNSNPPPMNFVNAKVL